MTLSELIAVLQSKGILTDNDVNPPKKVVEKVAVAQVKTADGKIVPPHLVLMYRSMERLKARRQS